MQPVSSHKKFSKPKYLLSLLLFSTLGTLSLLFLDYYFQVKKVEIISGKLKETQSFENIFIGKNILFLNEETVKKNISKSNPQVGDVRLEKIYPNTVRIRVELDNPVAILTVDQGLFVLNNSAKIISKVKNNNTNLPKINYYQKLNYSSFVLGDYVEYNDIKTTLFFLKKLEELDLGVVNVDINGLNMIRLNLKSGVILATTEKDLETQAYQLEKIIKQFRIEGKEFETLDLRFDKPVVKIK